ncbi:hypothetical protein [Salinisphaera orenii]|uniref:hypothetical protein n=1 Tax=Salinisphaera orenii TaxID=856731 RepID=UPI000F4C725F|nr:hypothetical protein [Salinisphaera orenii]
MHSERRTHTLCVAAMLGALLVAGCAHRPSAETEDVAHETEQAADPAIDLLLYAHELQSGSPEARAKAVEQARSAVDDAPDARNLARLALAYGAPKQTRYTPDLAARYAGRALEADDARWNAAARQYLRDYRRFYTRLTEQSPSDDDSEDARARIAELEAELDEAQRKLREMATIEERLGSSPP